jgi:hypothetical protein
MSERRREGGWGSMPKIKVGERRGKVRKNGRRRKIVKGGMRLVIETKVKMKKCRGKGWEALVPVFCKY